MKKRIKWTIPAVSVLVLMLGASGSLADTITFGSAADGLGGFTQSTVVGDEIWSTSAGSVQYRNQNAGTLNSSFLGEFILNRSSGSSYNIEGDVLLTDGYTDDNNRVGIYLFGDTPEIADQLEVGAIGLIFNTDDSSTGGPPGDNADDDIAFRVGIDSTSLSVADVPRVQTLTPYAQDLFGTSITLGANVTFFNDGLDDRIEINGYMIAGGDTTLLPSIDVLAADYTGDYFGFVTRARARNFPTDPTPTPEERSLPWVMDYQSFELTVIPEPSTLGLVAMMGSALLLFRRRFKLT